MGDESFGYPLPSTPEERVGWIIVDRHFFAGLIDSYDPLTGSYSVSWEYKPPFSFNDPNLVEDQVQDVIWIEPPHKDHVRCGDIRFAIWRGHSACVTGHPEVVDEQNRAALLSNAAAFGHVDIMKSLTSFGYEMGGRTLMAAASRGHVECLRWALSHGCPLRGKALGWNFLDDAKDWQSFEPLHSRCVEYFHDVQTVDAFLRNVAPLLDCPEDADRLSRIDWLVLTVARDSFRQLFPSLVDRRARF